MSRWGGFRKGRRRYTKDWDELKAPSAEREETVADTPQEFSYVEAKGIWNLNSTMQFPKSNKFEVPFSLTFVASAEDRQSIDIPTTAQAGDLVIFLNTAKGTGISSSDNPPVPDGFTRIRLDIDAADSIMHSCYAVLGDGYATRITGISESWEWCFVLVFRPSRSISSVTTFSVNGQATISDPSPQTIAMSLATNYLSVLAVAFMSGTSTVVPNVPASMTSVPTSVSSDRAFYQVFNPGDQLANITVDMPDEGDNAMQSWGLAIS
jgi:hypothetical protein